MFCNLLSTTKTFPFSLILIWRHGLSSHIYGYTTSTLKIWVPLIADDSLVYRGNEENDSMTFTLSQFFGKKHRRICSQKHISLLLEIFHVAPDVHLCSSIGFTGQSQCWIRTWSYCLLQFSRPYKMCCMAKKNRHDVDKAVKSLKDVWKMLFRTIFFQIR